MDSPENSSSWFSVGALHSSRLIILITPNNLICKTKPRSTTIRIETFNAVNGIKTWNKIDDIKSSNGEFYVVNKRIGWIIGNKNGSIFKAFVFTNVYRAVIILRTNRQHNGFVRLKLKTRIITRTVIHVRDRRQYTIKVRVITLNVKCLTILFGNLFHKAECDEGRWNWPRTVSKPVKNNQSTKVNGFTPHLRD